MRIGNTFAGGLVLASLWAVIAYADGTQQTERAVTMPTPLIHMTDLYQPPCDPDDHWDLATVYALAKSGRIQLLGVVLDYPLPPDAFGTAPSGAGEPAVQAVAQMNYITGLTVPAVLGASVSFEQVVEGDSKLTVSDAACLDFVVDTLRASPQPVAISVVGSCRNVALAAWKAPDVFREKCRGILLNAGTAMPNPDKPLYQEWNVSLDPDAYRHVFKIPCPVYWLPCFETPARFESARYGSYWSFKQGQVLPHLSQPVQNFLLYALNRSTEQRWLSVLRNSVDENALATQGGFLRNMWCTAGFLHAAGLSVTRKGDVVELSDLPPLDALYHFEPISVDLNENGIEEWKKAPAANGRFIIEVSDAKAYANYMPEALRALLAEL